MSIVIRRAALTDITRIVELAIESVSRNPLPLMIDRGAMTETALDLIKGGQHFARVAEVDGQVVGALGACTQPGFWHQRSTCSVLMFFATVPGAGLALIREFARWVKSRPTIKVAIFSLEPGMDPRIGTFLRRLGFTHETPCFSYVRGLQ